jgi:hypothetical protein
VEPDVAVGEVVDVVAGGVGFAVVVGAEESSVVEVGVAAVVPGGVVVGVTPGGGSVAAVGGAAALLDGQGDALVFGVQPAFAAHVEDDGAAVDEAAEDGGDDPGLAGEPSGLARGEVFAGVEAGGARTGEELS